MGSFRVGKNSGENNIYILYIYKYYIAACIYAIYSRTIDICIELICAEEKEIETPAEGILLRSQSIEHNQRYVMNKKNIFII